MNDPVYTLIMFTAAAVGALLLRGSQRGLPLPTGDRLAIGLAAFCGAMIGAKLPFVLFGDATVGGGAGGGASPGSPFGPWLNHWLAPWFGNGKTILTGLAGGYLAVEAAKALLGVRIKTGDSFAAPVAAAVAIGRLGCFRIGCCYGEPTALPWGVVFPAVDPVPRHPTQLYESLFHAAMAVTLVLLRRARRFERNLLKLYLIAYAAYRFATEYLRPEPEIALGLTAYQWVSLAMIALFALLAWRDAPAHASGAGQK